MQTFRLGILFEQRGYVNVQADTEQEAWDKINKAMGEVGLEALESEHNFHTTPPKSIENERGFSDYRVVYKHWEQV